MRNILRKPALVCLCLGLFVTGACAQSGGLTITPLRFELTEKQKMTAGHITNKKGDLLLVETKAYVWSQEDGFIRGGKTYEPKDVLIKTQEITFYPERFVVKPGATQTVRFKMKEPSEHKEFRVLFEEIGSANKSEKSLNFLTTLSLPFFNYDSVLKLQANSLKTSVVRVDGVDYLEIQNTSSQTLKVAGLKQQGDFKVELGYYLQPNIKSYVRLDKTILSSSGEVIDKKGLMLVTDKGDLEVKL